MQTLSLCVCSFLEAQASLLNATSQATTKESSTSNTSILRSPSKQDKKREQTYLKNPNRINQILCLGKGHKLLKLHTSCFLCSGEMWRTIKWIKHSAFFAEDKRACPDSKHLPKNLQWKIKHHQDAAEVTVAGYFSTQFWLTTPVTAMRIQSACEFQMHLILLFRTLCSRCHSPVLLKRYSQNTVCITSEKLWL